MSPLQRWRERSSTERRTYGAIAALAILVVLIVFAWLPLERMRSRLAAELPALRGSIATLERDAAEVKRLRSLPAAPSRSTAPLASLATNAGGMPGAQVTVMDERRVRVSGADVSYAALLEWLRAAQGTHGMRVESAKLDALPASGRVRADVLLTRG